MYEHSINVPNWVATHRQARDMAGYHAQETVKYKAKSPVSLLDMSSSDDVKLIFKNMIEGIGEYLDNNNKKYGKLYVTPFKTYEVLKQLEEDTGLWRKTILRRFKSKRKYLAGWYVITGDLPLQPDELCLTCDAIDDLLFAEDCWLDRVVHGHDTPITEESTIEYLFKGQPFKVTYGDWLRNVRPHLNN